MVFNMLPLAWCEEHGGHAAAWGTLVAVRPLLRILLTGCLGR